MFVGGDLTIPVTREKIEELREHFVKKNYGMLVREVPRLDVQYTVSLC